MSAPLYQYGAFSQDMSLVVAVIAGVFFGFFLERGGLGNPHKLTGVFYLTDFAVPKAMFTAVLVASSGLYLLSDLRLLDIGRVLFVPTYFWPQAAGGALFGIGYMLSGYCPGTSVAGAATGRIDALLAIVGIGAGSYLFADHYPRIEKFYMSSPMGTATVPGLIHFNHWIVIGVIWIIALLMFSLMEDDLNKTQEEPETGKQGLID
jgi:uncharacterized membrane protein YedE/YeeE